MILTGETEVLGEKHIPEPLCPRKITHRLAWILTLSVFVNGRQLTA